MGVSISMGSSKEFEGIKEIKKKKKLSYEERQAAATKAMREQARKRHAQFKKDRATKGKGNKSYNKGKPKSEWVDSAYDRRQKDATTAMRDAARKRHEEWKRKRKEKKNQKQALKIKKGDSNASKILSNNFAPYIK